VQTRRETGRQDKRKEFKELIRVESLGTSVQSGLFEDDLWDRVHDLVIDESLSVILDETHRGATRGGRRDGRKDIGTRDVGPIREIGVD